MHRRTNIGRPVYNDAYMQNEWIALITCVGQGNCNASDVKRKIVLNWHLQFPNEANVLRITEADILEVYYRLTIDGWHWQTPGNHNTPKQLYTFAANPLALHPTWSGIIVRLISSGIDLERDGWVSSAWRMVSRGMITNPHYANPLGPGTTQSFWDEKLYCGLRPNDITDPEDTDTSIALNNEHPHVYVSDTSVSFTNYVFPPDADATYGPYVGVHVNKTGPSSYGFQPCAYDRVLRSCTTAAYAALPAKTCSPATPLSPYM
jgi:hypothetical protein